MQKLITKALADDDGVLWITDMRGRVVGVPSDRVAYVEMETADGAKRVGFGRA